MGCNQMFLGYVCVNSIGDLNSSQNDLELEEHYQL